MTQETPNGWNEKILGEVCRIYTGNSINERVKKEKYTNLLSGHNYIATKDISFDSVIDYENGIKIPFKEPKFKVAPKNSSLLCIEGGSAGRKIGFTNQDVCFVNKLCVFCANEIDINARFLYYYLQTPKFKLVFYDKQTGLIGGVSTSKLKLLPIWYPSLAEQKRIVEKLDKIFADIDKAKANIFQNLKNAKELFESYLNKIFTEHTGTWTKSKLWEISNLKQSKNEIKLQENDLVSFVPMELLGIGQKYFSSNIKRELKDLIKDYTYFSENDLIMAKITPCFENGKIGIAKNLSNGIGFGSSEYIVFRPNKEVSVEYLYYFFNRNSFRKQGFLNMKGAVGHKRVAKEFIENYILSYPDRERQQIIVQKLDYLQEQTKKLEQIYEQKLKNLEELKQSILQQAFEGKL